MGEEKKKDIIELVKLFGWDYKKLEEELEGMVICSLDQEKNNK